MDRVGGCLRWASQRLSAARIPSPTDEARLLLADALQTTIASVMAHPERVLLHDQRRRFESYVDRRTALEPVAYIVGHREFYGLDFMVTPDVLIPRPETELLVERGLAKAEALLAIKGRDLVVADLGTGSGAVAVALVAGQPQLKVIAVDRSVRALEVAKENAARHQVTDRIEFIHGNLLRGITVALDLLVANLPYISSDEVPRLMPDVSQYEPHEALDGGPDGTVLIRRALEQSAGLMASPCSLLFEIGDGQGDQLCRHARGVFPEAEIGVDRDYAGFERILSIDLR